MHDYNMQWALEKVSRGIPVRHHMWGVYELQQDDQFEVTLLDFQKYPQLNRLLSHRWGNIDQQLRVLTVHKFDVVYATNYHIAMGLGFLRSIGVFRKPIVAVLFTLPSGGRQPRICMEGFSKIVCLSSLQAKILREQFPKKADDISVACWGWDHEVPPTSPYQTRKNEGYILSAGKTLRDYVSFCGGMKGLPAQAKIICPKAHLKLGLEGIPSNCELLSGDETWLLQDEEMTQMILGARAVAIPLNVSDTQPSGLTSLLEAMAHAKPVLMTRNPCIDIDIESLGFGRWIEPNSPVSWKEGIEYILEDDARAAEMGRRGRELIESTYNIENFGRFIGAEISKVA